MNSSTPAAVILTDAPKIPAGARTWRLAAWGLTAIVTLSVCYSLVRIPLQVHDSLIPILDAQKHGSVSAALTSSLRSRAYLRPFRMVQIQVLFELSRGHYFVAYKGFHVVLLMALFALVVAALRIRTAVDFLVFSFALTVLTGMHTFLGMVWEAYPINHFLEIAVFCMLALVLAQSGGGWWIDLLAALIFAVASLTLESGLLVWVVIVSAWIVGLRGISTRGVLIVTALVACYFGLRVYLSTGSPDLLERASGFGLHRLERTELTRRFADWPYPFYAYNVVCSFLSVLFAQPREGVWTLPQEWITGQVSMGTIVNIASSLLTTVLIGWSVARRARGWFAWRLEPADQIVIVALAVLAGNSAISYGYTKDVIPSPAGVFYALAAFVAVRDALYWAGERARSPVVHVALGLIMAVAASGWLVRAVGVHYLTHRIGMKVRNEWVDVDAWLKTQNEWPTDPAGVRLVETLRSDAVERDVVNTRLIHRWRDHLFR
jgi:hypothetical protein